MEFPGWTVEVAPGIMTPSIQTKTAVYVVKDVLLQVVAPRHCSQTISRLCSSLQLIHEHGNHELQHKKKNNDNKSSKEEGGKNKTPFAPFGTGSLTVVALVWQRWAKESWGL